VARLTNCDSSAVLRCRNQLLLAVHSWPDVDRAVLTAEFGDDLAANFAEGLRTGVDGWVDDDLAFVAPWGFSLAEMPCLPSCGKAART